MKAMSQVLNEGGRFIVEPLEVRRLLTAVTLAGSGNYTDFKAKLNTSTGNVDFYVNSSTPVQSLPKDEITSVKVLDPAEEGDSQLTIDVPGITLPLDLSATTQLNVDLLRGSLEFDHGQVMNSLYVGPGAVLTMDTGTEAVTTVVQVGGEFRHLSGQLNTYYLGVLSGGDFTDAGGAIRAASGLTIYNRGTFKAAFAGSLAGTTGTFDDGGHFIEDIGAGNTNSVDMTFVANDVSFNLASGTLRLSNWAQSYWHRSSLIVDGSAGTLSVPRLDLGGDYHQTGGTLSIDNSFELRGRWDPADVQFNGGTLNVGNNLSISCYVTGPSVFHQTGGNINAGEMVVGEQSDGGGWDQSGGTDHFGSLTVGYFGSTSDVLNLSGGSITADFAAVGFTGRGILNLSGTGLLKATVEVVGSWDGTGFLNQSGGTNNIGTLIVGYVLGGTGTYNLSGGSLIANLEDVAYANNQPGIVHGTILQTGGSNFMTAGLVLSEGGGGEAVYEMRGGTISLPYMIVGDGTSGRFLQTAGETNVTAALFVGSWNGLSSLLTLNGGTLTVTGNAYVGYESAGAVDQDGGAFNVQANLYVTGSGSDGDSPNGHGAYNLSGTGVASTSMTYVGYGGDGEFYQGGGTYHADYFVYNGPSGSTGTVNRTSGIFDANNVINVLRPSASGLHLAHQGVPYELDLSATSLVGNNAISGWAVDWGDQANETFSGNPTSRSHTFNTSGLTREIQATAFGGGRTYRTPPTNVYVAPAAANLLPIAARSVDAGSSITVSTTFGNPGTGHTYTARIDWGDGTVQSDVQVETTTYAGTVTANHTFRTHGTYTGVLTLLDDAGGITSTPFSVIANYVAPVFSVSTPAGSVFTGQETTVTMKASGVEASGVTNWKVDWGDGTITNYPGRSLTPEADVVQSLAVHAYTAPGTYSIHVWAADSASATHDAGMIAKTITLAPKTSGGEHLSIRGPTAGSVGAYLSFQVGDGSNLPLTSSLTYVWSVSKDEKTVATGTGLTFQFSPKTSGSYVARVTEIGDPTGPFVATHALEVSAPVGAVLPIEGPSTLEVGHAASFNFNQQPIWDLFGAKQIDDWTAQAHRTKSSAGPHFIWTVQDQAGTTLKTVDAGMIWGDYTSYVSPTLMFSAAQPGSYSISLVITYEGKTYFQDAETLAGVVPAIANVTSRVLPSVGETEQGMKGDSALENPDGSLLIINQAHTPIGLPQRPWEITKLQPDLTIDKTFGNFGRVAGPLVPLAVKRGAGFDQGYWNTKGAQVVLQPDGKFIVVASMFDLAGVSPEQFAYENNISGSNSSSILSPIEWIIARYNSDGTLDHTFGAPDPGVGGTTRSGIILDDDHRLNEVQHIALEPDGKILLAGSGFTPSSESGNTALRPAFLVKRLNQDGTFDDSFGVHGSSLVAVANDAAISTQSGTLTTFGMESALSLAIQPSGKIIVGGVTSATHDPFDYDENFTTPVSSSFALVRLNRDGSLDLTFGPNGANGRVITSFATATNAAMFKCAVIRDIGIDPSGDIIAMGTAGDAESDIAHYKNARFAIAKYSADGVLVSAFGSAGDGKVISTFYGNEWAYSGALTPSGDIVMAGDTVSGALIAKFRNNGSVDTAFGDGAGVGGVELIEIPQDGDPPPGPPYKSLFRNVIVLQSKTNKNDVLVTGSGELSRNEWYPGGGGDVVVARYHPTELSVSQLVASARSTGPIDLTWQNTGTGQDGFQVLRSTTPGGLSSSPVVVAAVGPDQTSYSDVDVTANTTYYYQVRAFRTVGASVTPSTPGLYSNVASAVAAAVNTGYVLQEAVPVDYDGSTRTSKLVLQQGVVYMLQATGAISQTVDGVFRGDAEDAFFPVDGSSRWWNKRPVGPLNGFDFGIAVAGTGAATGNVYNKFPYWGVQSSDSDHTYGVMVVGNGQKIGLAYRDTYYPDNSSTNPGDKPLSVSIYRALPSSPGSLVATSDRESRQINLAWSNYANDSTKVLVQRAGDDGKFLTVATLRSDATQYVDPVPAISFNKLYSYRVIAQGQFADSTPSNTAYSVLTNLPPQIEPFRPLVAYAGGDYKYQVVANDGDGGTTGLVYEITSGPPGLSIDISAGQMAWTLPADTALGAYTGSMRVTDADGAATTSSFSIVVGPQKDTIPTAAVTAHLVSQTSSTLTLGVTGMVPSSPGAVISYTWSAVARPGAAGIPTFSKNGTADASETVVTLHGAGKYQFQVSMVQVDVDPTGYIWPGLSQTPAINVGQVLTGVSATPIEARAQAGSAQRIPFRAVTTDQFNQPLVVPSTFAWEILSNADGSLGSIAADGMYTPPAVGGFTATVKVTAVAQGETRSTFASVTVSNDSAQAPVLDADSPDVFVLSFSDLRLTASAQDPLHPGSDSHLTYTWRTTDRPLNAPEPRFSLNGTNVAKNAVVTCSELFPFNYTFEVTVRNELGQTAVGSIAVSDDRTFKKIVLTPKITTTNLGKTVHYSAVAVDQFDRPLAVQPSFQWSVDSAVITEVASSAFDYVAPDVPGQHAISVTATSDGVQQSMSTELSVVGQLPPVLRIDGMVGNDANQPVAIDKATEVRILADDINDDDPVSWQLWLVDAAGRRTQLAGGDKRAGKLPASYAGVFTLNPEQFADGLYTLQLATTLTSAVADQRTLDIHSLYKIGGLRLPFLDAEIDVPGSQPLTATRVYDSMRANVSGKFGFGWTLQMSERPDDFRTTAFAGDYTDKAGVPALRSGDVVYLKTPDGQQHAFAFVPKKNTNSTGTIAGVVSYAPQFVAIDDSRSQLIVSQSGSQSFNAGNPIELRQDITTGEWFYNTGSGNLGTAAGYNPKKASFGNSYTLITDDKSVYTLDGSGHLKSGVDPNGHVVDYASGGVADGRRFSTQTDDAGRITGISDVPNCTFSDPTQFVEYTYEAGDLHAVRDRSQNVTTFAYETVDGVSTHRLTTVTDARGVHVVTANYDASTHLLEGLTDAGGHTAAVSTAPLGDGQTSQVAKDAVGGKTESVYDDHGNVVREIQQVRDSTGGVTGYRVTRHEYLYGLANKSGFDQAEKFGVTNIGKLLRSTDYAPFLISGIDAAGERYTKTTDAISHRVDYKFIDGGDAYPERDQGLFQPTSVQSTGPHGLTAITYLKYFGPGKPEIVEDTHGGFTWMQYDIHGNLIATINAVGEGTATDYDDKGRVVATYRATGVGGSETAMPTITRGLKLNTTEYFTTTDASTGAYAGKVASTIDETAQPEATPAANKLKTLYAYYVGGPADGLTEELRRTWTDAQGTHSVRQSLTEYDAMGRAIKVTDGHGKSTETHYDAAGQVAYTVDAFAGKTAMVYDARGQVVRTVYPDGTETRTAYDALGRAEFTSDRSFTGATVDTNGVPSAASNTAASFVTRTLYDSLGQVVGTERYKDVVVSIVTDDTAAGGPLLKAVAPAASVLTSSRRLSTTGTTYDDQGRVIDTRDAAGSVTHTAYYADGQVQTVTTAAGTANAATTAYDYDRTDNLPVGTVSYDSVTDANGHVTKTYKDALGRVVRTLYVDGSFAAVEYGPFGSVTRTYDQRKATDPPTYTERDYDSAGRLTDVSLPAVTDADPSSATFNQSVRPHWHYAYDAAGNELSQTDPKGRVTAFTYDDFGDRTSRTLPPDSDGSTADDTERWTYDAFGRTATHADFKGQTTVYVYDDTPAHGGRLSEEDRYAGGVTGTPAEKTVYGYDALGHQASVDEYANGNLATPTRHTATAYDPLTGGVAVVDAPEGVLRHAYDPATGRLTRTWTANNDTRYDYDAQGRLWHVMIDKLNGQSYATPLVTTYGYDAVGDLLTTVSDQGTAAATDDVSETDAYDAMNRLTSLTAKVGTVTVFDQGSFTYSADGQKTGLLEHRYDEKTGAETARTRMTWAYDADGRLTREVRDAGDDDGGQPTNQNAGDYADAFTFDPNGNRLTKTHTTLNAQGQSATSTTVNTYNDRDELATTQTNGGPVTVPQYDANGSTLNDGTRAYTWDLRNRMASVTTGGVTTAYAYDENGVRVGKTVGTGAARTFVNDALNPTGYTKPVEEDVGGNADASYVLGLTVLGQANATTGYLSLIQDGQGKTRNVVNLSGVDVQDLDYDAYGNALAAGLTATPWQNPDGYTDFESGLTQQLARSLDRQTGEWASEDPTVFGTGEYHDANLHVYVGGSPLTGRDSTGNFIDAGTLATSLGIAATLTVVLAVPLLDVLAKTAVHGITKAVDNLLPDSGESRNGSYTFVHGGTTTKSAEGMPTDFGSRYYAFAANERGVRDATDRAKSNASLRGGTPYIEFSTISSFDYDNMSKMYLAGGSEEWNSAVTWYRQSNAYQYGPFHDYDLLYGPLATKDGNAFRPVKDSPTQYAFTNAGTRKLMITYRKDV